MQLELEDLQAKTEVAISRLRDAALKQKMYSDAAVRCSPLFRDIADKMLLRARVASSNNSKSNNNNTHLVVSK